jgi:hypothetical protein
MSAMATEAQALVEQPPASETPVPVAAPATAPQTPTDKQPKDKDKGKGKGKESKNKDAKDKRGKGGKGAASEDPSSPSVAAHPRAARVVAQAKGWGGLAGFFLAGYLSLPTGTLAEAALRALIAGSVCYVAAWAAAVFVWRRLIALEIKGREQALLTGALAALGPGEPGSAPAERSRTGVTSPAQSTHANATSQAR